MRRRDPGASLAVLGPGTLGPLHVCSQYGKLAVVQRHVGALTSSKARVKAINNHDNPNKQTPLHVALQHGHDDVARFFLANKANIECADRNNKTPLLYCARYGRTQMCALLLDEGANVEAVDRYGETCLHLAAIHGHEEVMTLLLERNVIPVNTVNKHNETALHKAARMGNLAMVRLLLQAGCDPTLQGQSGKAINLLPGDSEGTVAIIRAALRTGERRTAYQKRLRADTLMHEKLPRMVAELPSDRKTWRSNHMQCFTGTEFIQWLLTHDVAAERSKAFEYGELLMSTGYIQPVTSGARGFSASSTLYRFMIPTPVADPDACEGSPEGSHDYDDGFDDTTPTLGALDSMIYQTLSPDAFADQLSMTMQMLMEPSDSSEGESDVGKRRGSNHRLSLSRQRSIDLSADHSVSPGPTRVRLLSPPPSDSIVRLEHCTSKPLGPDTDLSLFATFHPYEEDFWNVEHMNLVTDYFVNPFRPTKHEPAILSIRVESDRVLRAAEKQSDATNSDGDNAEHGQGDGNDDDDDDDDDDAVDEEGSTPVMDLKSNPGSTPSYQQGYSCLLRSTMGYTRIWLDEDMVNKYTAGVDIHQRLHLRANALCDLGRKRLPGERYLKGTAPLMRVIADVRKKKKKAKGSSGLGKKGRKARKSSRKGKSGKGNDANDSECTDATWWEPDPSTFAEAMLNFDRHIGRSRTITIGVILCTSPDQDESAMMRNGPSEALTHFMNSIADPIELKGWGGFAGGMDPTSNGNAYYTQAFGCEVLFHVAPLLTQGQQRQHIGNDKVLWYFQDFDADNEEKLVVPSFRGNVNSVGIVVRPQYEAGDMAEADLLGYRMDGFVRKGIPEFGPPTPGTMVPLDDMRMLKAWLLTKSLNGHAASYLLLYSRQIARLWSEEVAEVVEKYPRADAFRRRYRGEAAEAVTADDDVLQVGSVGEVVVRAALQGSPRRRSSSSGSVDLQRPVVLSGSSSGEDSLRATVLRRDSSELTTSGRRRFSFGGRRNSKKE